MQAREAQQCLEKERGEKEGQEESACFVEEEDCVLEARMFGRRRGTGDMRMWRVESGCSLCALKAIAVVGEREEEEERVEDALHEERGHVQEVGIRMWRCVEGAWQDTARILARLGA
jgi:hypothetical protein